MVMRRRRRTKSFQNFLGYVSFLFPGLKVYGLIIYLTVSVYILLICCLQSEGFVNTSWSLSIGNTKSTHNTPFNAYTSSIIVRFVL